MQGICVPIECPLEEAVVGHDMRLSGWVQSEAMGSGCLRSKV